MMEPTRLSESERERFERHLRLPEVGAEGQARLKTSRVLVVGAGGLGSPALMYLAAAGIGRIGIADPDRVEIGNLHRQVIHGMSSLGERKVESARRRLLENNPDCVIDTYPERLTEDNAAIIAAPYEVVLDGTDNLEARRLINQICIRQKKPMVYGSAQRWEGQVCVFDARHGACYECAFYKVDQEKTVSPVSSGVLGPLPGLIGVWQALETIKILLGKGAPLYGRLQILDGLSGSIEEINIPRNIDCPACGKIKPAD